ncbi:MauE/DoxX family redox-associated membrane protein [Ilumatobacter sp.]|uniref:MauE/DoxX family redox-associated membrane protein n=1 Tax=Ilumatobacter sp. TaxID=1967498 RepID=UPI003C41D703
MTATLSGTDATRSTVTSDRATSRSRSFGRHRVLGLVVPLQIFLATGWLRAGIEKVIDPTWWSGDHLLDFLEQQRPQMLPWFVWFSDGVLTPLAPLVAWLVVAMQLVIAACLATNRWVARALWAGVLLNVCFTMAGAVNPSAFYLVMEMALLFSLSRPIREAVANHRAVAWLIPAALFAPFARTIEPSRVVDDPALMLSTLCVIAAVTTLAAGHLAHRNH